MPRVFVANQPLPSRQGMTYDVSPAMQYGEIRFVFADGDPVPSRNLDAAIDHAYSVLQTVREEDYLVWAGGDPLSMVIVSSIISDYLDGKIRYLKWERARDGQGRRTSGGYYVPMIVDLSTEDNE